jgi:hypothetical protein
MPRREGIRNDQRGVRKRRKLVEQRKRPLHEPMGRIEHGLGRWRWVGCNRSWNQGRSACPNRLTIRMKVAEPQILGKLKSELLKPQAPAYISTPLEREVHKALTAPEDEAKSIESPTRPGAAEAPEPDRRH